jgi:putative membrane protein
MGGLPLHGKLISVTLRTELQRFLLQTRVLIAPLNLHFGRIIMKPAKLFIALSIAASLAAVAQAQNSVNASKNATTNAATSAATTISKDDAARLVGIAQANIAEIETGKLALKKSSNPDVKAYAQMMIDDHTKGLQETKKVAAAKRVTLPSETDIAHQKLAAELEALSAEKFDEAYAKRAGVAGHANVQASLTKDMSAVEDPDVKALAAKLEPTVAHHLAMAKKLAAAVK